MKINAIELEKILIANWTAFLNPREMIQTATYQAVKKNLNGPITNLTVSRFELTPSGFILWMEFKANNTRITTEALLMFNGKLSVTKTEIT